MPELSAKVKGLTGAQTVRKPVMTVEIEAIARGPIMNPPSTHRALRTVGVEEEFLLVDPETGRPTAAVETALAAAHRGTSLAEDIPAEQLTPTMEREVKQEQIEAVSPPSDSIDELATAILAGRRVADAAAQSVGARAVALATSVLPVSTHAARDSRYEAMATQFGLTFREQLTCGFHVHVAIESDEEGVAVLDRIRPWLPILLALSSNSPFWMGQDTEYASYRYQAWSRWPSAGPYDIFGSAQAYRSTVSSLLNTGVLLDRGMVYFDARLCTHYPTVEIRMADVCLDPEVSVAIAALVRALVETAAQEWRTGCAPEPVPTGLLRLAMWSASRFGIEEDLVNPLLGEPCEARVAVDALLAHVQAALTSSGDAARVAGTVARVFREGTGARLQRDTFERTRSLSAVVAGCIELTHPTSVSAPVGTPA